MGALLYYIGVEVILVVYDDVVGWPNLPLETGMRLEVEVEQERGRETSILDRARECVAVVRFLIGRRGVESAVMSLPTDDNGDLRLIIRTPRLLERLDNVRTELLLEYVIVLTLSPHLNKSPDLGVQRCSPR